MKGVGAFVFFVIFCLLIMRLPNDTGLQTGALLAETPTPRPATLVPMLGVAGEGIETTGQLTQDASELGVCSGSFGMILVLVIGVIAANCLRVNEE